MSRFKDQIFISYFDNNFFIFCFMNGSVLISVDAEAKFSFEI